MIRNEKQLLAHASHELRTPLARLRMAIELAWEKSLDENLYTHAIEYIEELDHLVGDLLA